MTNTTSCSSITNALSGTTYDKAVIISSTAGLSVEKESCKDVNDSHEFILDFYSVGNPLGDRGVWRDIGP